jgi:hypothetical protein
LQGQRSNPIWNDVSSAAKFVRPATITLQLFGQTWLTKNFGVQALGRDKQDRKVKGVRGIDLLAADLFRACLDLGLKLASEKTDQFGIASRDRFPQVLVIFAREFRIDWQQNLLTVGREFDGVFDHDHDAPPKIIDPQTC